MCEFSIEELIGQYPEKDVRIDWRMLFQKVISAPSQLCAQLVIQMNLRISMRHVLKLLTSVQQEIHLGDHNGQWRSFMKNKLQLDIKLNVEKEREKCSMLFVLLLCRCCW